MALSLIKDAFQLQKANRKVKDPNSYVSVLNAAKPSGVFYFLRRFFNSFLGAERNSILKEELKIIKAGNKNEITKTFINIAMKLPSEYKAISNSTNKVLYFNKDEGYVIKLIGYKIVGFEVAKNKQSLLQDEDKFVFVSSEYELTNLQKEGDYNKFKDRLLRQFKESDEWGEYITDIKDRLNQLILNSQADQYVVDKFSSEQLQAYRKARIQPTSKESVDIEVEVSEVGKGKEKVTFAESLEEVTALDIENAELYLHDHEDLIAELLKLGLGNSLLRQELSDYFESVEDTIEASKLAALTLLKAFNNLYEVPEEVQELHYDNTKVMWQIFGNLGSKSTQEFLKFVKYKKFALLDSKGENSRKEVITLLGSIRELLKTYDPLKGGVNQRLYTNENKGFMVVQEGKEIVLYTGRPYTLLNPKLRYRIADLEIGYDRLKEKVNAVLDNYKEEKGKPLKGRLELLGGGANKRFFVGLDVFKYANRYFVKTKTLAIADKEYTQEAKIQEYVKEKHDEELTKICSFQERIGKTKYAKVGGPGKGNPVTYLQTITDPDEKMKKAVEIAILLLDNLNILQKNKLSHGDLHLDNMKVDIENGNLRLEIFDWGHAQVNVKGRALMKDARYIYKGGDLARQIQTNLGEKFMPKRARKHGPIEKIILAGGFDEGFYKKYIEGFRKKIYNSIMEPAREEEQKREFKNGVKALRDKLVCILLEHKYQQDLQSIRMEKKSLCGGANKSLIEKDGSALPEA
jgi:hypothetical protein